MGWLVGWLAHDCLCVLSERKHVEWLFSHSASLFSHSAALNELYSIQLHKSRLLKRLVGCLPSQLNKLFVFFKVLSCKIIWILIEILVCEVNFKCGHNIT